MNKILKDIIVKYKTLRGFCAPYVPGWDCHGLPIEFKVTQEMRKTSTDAAGASSADFDPATIRDLATFENPNQLSEGMEYVLVNGVPVIDQGKMTGKLPGKVLRGAGYVP